MKRSWRTQLGAATLAAAFVVGYGFTHAGRFLAQGAPMHADASPFTGLTWREIGPNRGGRSIAVAGSAARPLEYYFGAVGGGLWKTTDGGTTWHPVTDQKIQASSVGAIAIAPSNPDIVYIGTGESEIRGNIIQGNGIYKTTDGGKTWTHVGLTDSQAISKIRVDPTNPDLVYAAVFGHPYGPNAERGVFKSTDGGRTWTKVLYRDDKTGAIDLALDPGNPQVMYAALWEAFRTPYSMSSGGPGSGLFKSTDGGSTWTEITRNPGLPKGVIGKIGITVSGADSNRVYALVEAADGGVYRSDDGGATWTKTNDERKLRQRAFYYSRIYADPKVKDEVYVVNTGFYRSTDGGKTFNAIRTPHGDNHDLWIAPNDTDRMIECNDGGANVTWNGGKTWTAQDFPTAQFYHVMATSKIPYDVCGSQQDNSTACVSSAGDGSEFYEVGGGESGYVVSDPRNPNIFYAGSYGGLITRYDHSTGQLRAINPYPDNPMGYATKDIAERFQWTTPIVISPTDPNVIYVGSQHLWKTTDEGASWQKISPDLTLHEADTMEVSGGPITHDESGVETYATIFAIAPSPKDANVIWVGSDDGLVHLTRDGGQTWKDVTPSGLPHLSRISIIEASPFAPGTAYLTANHYQMDDFAPYVYRTDDYGATWTKIIDGVAPRDFARSIREDPTRQHLLYLGTEHGIYVSFDNGDHWQSLRLNLPDTSVQDLVLKDNDLVIATHGRGFYVLDNISPIRQWMPGETTTGELHVFKPVEARIGLDRSADVDYYLTNAAQKVTIEFLDAQGTVIHAFTGTPETAKKPQAPANPFFRGPVMTVGVSAGLHRFHWDMRYPGYTTFPGMILWAARAAGPVAPPGTYQVKITADGQTQAQSLVLAKDPRLTGITDADLQKQFDLAIKVRDKVSQANDAVLLIRGIKPQLADRIEQAGKLKGTRGKAIEAAAKGLQDQLTTIEEAIYQVQNRASEDPLNFPIRLNNKIAALLGVVGMGQYPPTQQDYTVFAMLSDQLTGQLTKLDQAVKTDLPKLNRLLAERKLEAVKAEPLKVKGDEPAGEEPGGTTRAQW